MRGFIRGVKDIGKLIADVEPELDACDGMKDDMKRIEMWSRVFFNPETLAMTLMAHTYRNKDALLKNIDDIEADIT